MRLRIGAQSLRMTYEKTIRSQADVQQMWRDLMGAGGFGGRSIWLTILEADGHTTPLISEITECDSPLDHLEQERFATLLRHLCLDGVPGGRVALLCSRPGTHGLDDEDRRWAASLYASCRLAEVHHEVVHLATELGVVPVPFDELPLTA